MYCCIGADFNAPLSVSKCIATTDGWLGFLNEDVLKIGQQSARLAHLSGGQDTEIEKRCKTVDGLFTAMRGVLDATRVIPAGYKLFSGEMFVTKGFDEPCQPRDWKEVSMGVLVCVARFFSPVLWLDKYKVIDIGHHAKWMGSVILAIWGYVTAFYFAQSVQSLSEASVEDKPRWIWEVFQITIDGITLLFDLGLGSLHPALAITECVVNLIEAVSYCAKDIAFALNVV